MVKDRTKWGIWTYLDYYWVEPLFRSDLSPAERIPFQYFVANTVCSSVDLYISVIIGGYIVLTNIQLCHELMHAIVLMPSNKGTNNNTSPVIVEPYYGESAATEIGFEWKLR